MGERFEVSKARKLALEVNWILDLEREQTELQMMGESKVVRVRPRLLLYRKHTAHSGGAGQDSRPNLHFALGVSRPLKVGSDECTRVWDLSSPELWKVEIAWRSGVLSVRYQRGVRRLRRRGAGVWDWGRTR